MHRHRMINTVMVALLACALWLQGAGTVLAQCPGSAAVNSGFEEGFSERGAGEVTVANGWQPWWQQGPFENDGYNHRPEYKAEDAARFGRRRVRNGNWAQKMFNTYSTHHAGLRQQINVPAGSVVTLQAWGQAWSSGEDDANVSKGGAYALSVGIDPTGGTDFNSGNIAWSPRSSALDQWVELKVQARAQAGTVTLYLRGDAEYRLKHNDAYFDDVCVTVVRPTAPPPAPTKRPAPTNTPEPTATPEPTVEPSPTLAPTEPATPTPMPGSIRVFVFEDRDGDGVRDAEESVLAGAKVELLNAQRTPVASHVTDGSDGYTFEGLVPGSYLVVETDPPGYTSTSPNEWGVALAPGTQFDVTLADRFAPSPTPTRQPTTAPTAPPQPTAVPPTAPAPTPTPASHAAGGLGNLSGILVAVLALALPITLRVLKARI